MKVADVLAVSHKPAYTVKPSDTVAALSSLLREKHIGAAVVSKDGRSIDGVISERDIAYKLSQHDKGIADLPVSTLMTRTVVTCSLKDPVATIASTMLARDIRHLPIVDDGGRLMGMVSIRDVLKWRVDELQREAALLRTLASPHQVAPQDRE